MTGTFGHQSAIRIFIRIIKCIYYIATVLQLRFECFFQHRPGLIFGCHFNRRHIRQFIINGMLLLRNPSKCIINIFYFSVVYIRIINQYTTRFDNTRRHQCIIIIYNFRYAIRIYVIQFIAYFILARLFDRKELFARSVSVLYRITRAIIGVVITVHIRPVFVRIVHFRHFRRSRAFRKVLPRKRRCFRARVSVALFRYRRRPSVFVQLHRRRIRFTAFAIFLLRRLSLAVFRYPFRQDLSRIRSRHKAAL